jgi:quercetin dioxygenase-like cupin family protein
MRKLSIATLLFILALTAWTQQAQAPVEITSEPHHHLVFDNTFVRVFAVSVDPGTSTLMHRHGHDYFSVSIGDAQIMNAKEGAQPVAVTFKDGDVRFTATGLVHAVTNSSDKPFRNRTIELLAPTTNQKACTESCAIPVPCDSADKAACASAVTLFTSDQWTATMATLPPGAKLGEHEHKGSVLTVPLSDADLTMKSQGKPDVAVHQKAGDVIWNDPQVHAVNNTGKTAAKVFVLEFQAGPQKIDDRVHK